MQPGESEATGNQDKVLPNLCRNIFHAMSQAVSVQAMDDRERLTHERT